MFFHWSLSDCKSPQVSRTLLNILTVLNNAVVWMVSTRPPTSKSSSPFSNPLVTVPNAPITVSIIVTFMFHSFFNSLARSRYLSFFSLSFNFILWSAWTAKSTILHIPFFLLIIIGKYAREMYGMLQTAFRPSCMNRTSVFEWHKRFKEGRESVTDDERCGRSKEVNTPELIG